MQGTRENIEKNLEAVIRSLDEVNKKVGSRSTIEAKNMHEGFKSDIAKIRAQYSQIDTSDHQQAITELIKLQAKEEYVQDMISGFEKPIQEKKYLEEQRRNLQKELKERSEAEQTR